MTSTANDLKLANFFNKYLFENVWNEPRKEYRKNIRPLLISKPIASGSIKLNWKRYALPSSEHYHVYHISKTALGGLSFTNFPDWITAIELLERTRVELRFHNNDGIMLPRGEVYIANHPEDGGLIIAIRRELSVAIHGASVDYNDLFVAIYADSDIANDVVIHNYVVTPSTNLSPIYADTADATAVYVDGILVDVQAIEDIGIANKYIEVVKDTNVIGTFVIDLADAAERRNFISTIDSQSKTIIHIPKAINPTNMVISHHTCDLYIYPRNGENTHRNGRFFHRAIATYSFSQITHNDFAIPDAVIDSYTDTLDIDEFVLHVHVKTHSKDNVLIREKNYIQLLYTHDDDVILDFMEGVGPEDFDFWKAATLESSGYTKMISDVPNFVKVSNLPEHIDALGYYNSVALVSDRVRSITLEEYGGEVSHRFIIPVSVIFEARNIDIVVTHKRYKDSSPVYKPLIR